MLALRKISGQIFLALLISSVDALKAVPVILFKVPCLPSIMNMLVWDERTLLFQK